MKQLLFALTFLTRLPIPNPYKYNEKNFASSIWLYPIVGAMIGGILILGYFGVSFITPNVEVRALILIFLYVLISGGLHLDGLADTCDGIFSGRNKERILEIMQDSRIGTFGVISLILYFLCMFIVLQVVDWQVLFIYPIIGRASVLLGAGISKYARESGLGKVIVDSANIRHVIYSVLLTIIIGGIVDIKMVISIGITFIWVIFVTLNINNKLSGITGDVMGMLIESSQCVFLLAVILI